MRGKDISDMEKRNGRRITPAHAGKRCGEKFSSSLNQDHPRTCGEKLYMAIRSRGKKGSPPHMRGKA